MLGKRSGRGSRWFRTWGPCALVACAACASFPQEDVAPAFDVDPGELGGMSNVYAFDGVWVATGSDPADLEVALRRGFVLLVDVGRSPTDLTTEAGIAFRQAAARQSVRWVHAPIDAGEPSPAALDVVFDELRAADGPALVYSRHGDEAALVFSLWRASSSPVEYDDLLRDARRAGLRPGEQELALADALAFVARP